MLKKAHFQSPWGGRVFRSFGRNIRLTLPFMDTFIITRGPAPSTRFASSSSSSALNIIIIITIILPFLLSFCLIVIIIVVVIIIIKSYHYSRHNCQSIFYCHYALSLSSFLSLSSLIICPYHQDRHAFLLSLCFIIIISVDIVIIIFTPYHHHHNHQAFFRCHYALSLSSSLCLIIIFFIIAIAIILIIIVTIFFINLKQSQCVNEATTHYSGVVNGTIHVVVGGGGSHLSDFSTVNTQWSLFKDMDYGFVKLTAFNHSFLQFEYKKSSDGKVYDSFTISRDYRDVLACVHDGCSPTTLAS